MWYAEGAKMGHDAGDRIAITPSWVIFATPSTINDR
jgi:hypothetical protein